MGVACSSATARNRRCVAVIENQFNTSMTATLKTLNNHSKAPDGEDEDEDEKASGGLLGRLKNTFKS